MKESINKAVQNTPKTPHVNKNFSDEKLELIEKIIIKNSSDKINQKNLVNSITKPNRRSQGIDYLRLLNPENTKNLDEIIKCKICFQILINPVDCSGCQKSFCYDCIFLLKDVNKNCPFGCDLREIEIKNSSFAIKTVLSFLKFSCGNMECKEEISYNDVITHEENCKFLNIICPNINCNMNIKKFEFENHIKNDCEFNTYICETCGNEYKKNEFDKHVKTCRSLFQIILGKGFGINSLDKKNNKVELNDFKFDELIKRINILNKSHNSDISNNKSIVNDNADKINYNQQSFILSEEISTKNDNNKNNQLIIDNKKKEKNQNIKNIVKKLFKTNEKENFYSDEERILINNYDSDNNNKFINEGKQDKNINNNKTKEKFIPNLNDKFFKEMLEKFVKINEENTNRFLTLSSKIEKINDILEKIQENEKSILDNTMTKEKVYPQFNKNNYCDNIELKNKNIEIYEIQNFQISALPNVREIKSDTDSFLENSAFVNNMNNLKKITRTEFNILSNEKSRISQNKFMNKYVSSKKINLYEKAFNNNYDDYEDQEFNEIKEDDAYNKINDLKSFIKNNNNKNTNKKSSNKKNKKKIEIENSIKKSNNNINDNEKFELNTREFSLKKIIHSEENSVQDNKQNDKKFKKNNPFDLQNENFINFKEQENNDKITEKITFINSDLNNFNIGNPKYSDKELDYTSNNQIVTKGNSKELKNISMNYKNVSLINNNDLKFIDEIKAFDKISCIFSDKTILFYIPTQEDLEFDELASNFKSEKNQSFVHKKNNNDKIEIIQINDKLNCHQNYDEIENTHLQLINNMNLKEEITPIKINNQTDNCIQRNSIIDDLNNINNNIKSNINFDTNKKDEFYKSKKSIFEEHETEHNFITENSNNTHIVVLNDKTISNEKIKTNLNKNKLENFVENTLLKQNARIDNNYKEKTCKLKKIGHNFSIEKNENENLCEEDEVNSDILNNEENSKEENKGHNLEDENPQIENSLKNYFDEPRNKSKFNILFNSLLIEFSKMNKKMNLMEGNVKSYFEQMESFNNESIFNKNSALFFTRNKSNQMLLDRNEIDSNAAEQTNNEEIKNLLDLSNRKIDYLTDLIKNNFRNINSLSNNNNIINNSNNSNQNNKINAFAITEGNEFKSCNLTKENENINVYLKPKSDSKNISSLEEVENEGKINNNSIKNNKNYENSINNYSNIQTSKIENFLLNANRSKTHDSLVNIPSNNNLNTYNNINSNFNNQNFIHNNLITNQINLSINNLFENLFEKIDEQKQFQAEFICKKITENIENQYDLDKSCNICMKIKFKFENKECFSCLSKYCKDCAQFCLQCGCILCPNCIGCRICQEPICLKCRKECSSCKTDYIRQSQLYSLDNGENTSSNKNHNSNENNNICLKKHALTYNHNNNYFQNTLNNNHNTIALSPLNNPKNRAILLCERCLIRCFHCNQLSCLECMQECQKCNKSVCHENKNNTNNLNINNSITVKNTKKSCSKTCKNCAKCICITCESGNDFYNCPCCKDYFCNSCKSICLACKQVICRKCVDKCKKCQKTICKKCSIGCNNCREAFCALDICSKQNFKSKCKKCHKNFCNICMKDYTAKCQNCQEAMCKKCILTCGKCQIDLCNNPNCNPRCDNCSGAQCSKCLIICTCLKYKFCETCSLDISPINPHECNTLSNDSPYFRGFKGRSKIKLPKKKFEMKIFLEKYSGENLSIGVTDNSLFDEDTMLFIDNIWVLKLNNGMKYSSDNSLEPYLKSGGLKAFDFLYLIMENGNSLFFKVNNNPLQKAFNLDENKDFYLYLENDDNKKDFKITIIYIRNL